MAGLEEKKREEDPPRGAENQSGTSCWSADSTYLQDRTWSIEAQRLRAGWGVRDSSCRACRRVRGQEVKLSNLSISLVEGDPR